VQAGDTARSVTDTCVVFLTFCAGDQAAVPAQAWTILVIGGVISFLGVPAGLIGNELSIRYRLRTICVAEILGVAGYSIAPALLPQFSGGNDCRRRPGRSRDSRTRSHGEPYRCPVLRQECGPGNPILLG
jgi:hypothetical protein